MSHDESLEKSREISRRFIYPTDTQHTGSPEFFYPHRLVEMVAQANEKYGRFNLRV